MPGTSPQGTGLRRSLSVWQAIGLSIALMAPSMAANINPQASAATAGRAVPLAFLIAAVGVLLVAYTFVRLCQYYHHSGSVYAFVGATLGPRAGVVAGWGLLGTYTFYAVVTSSAAGIFGTAFLNAVGGWPHPPSWAPFLLAGVALAVTLLLAIVPARRGTNVLLSVEGATVALIGIVTVIVLVRLLSGSAPGGHHFTLSVFSVPPGTSFSPLFLAVVFGFLSFAGFEAAATLGEEATHPTRDIPRAILGTAVFGGIYFVVVTVIYLAAFHANAEDSFAWSGTIGTLILLVAYVLATTGCMIGVFVRRKLPVPMWQAVVPLMALVVLGYTLYRNVIPYPPSGPGRWFPVVAGGWLVLALVAVIVAPGFARRLGAALTASGGIAAPQPATTAPTELPAGDAAGDRRRPRA